MKRGKKPSRVLSGVTVVAVMTAPYPCPHGRCAYCPGGPDLGTPQSYYGEEPALMRASKVNYDPYEQVRVRLRQYEFLGYRPSKVDVIVMGGTFTALPEWYQEWFVTSLFEAFNNYPRDRSEVLPSLEEAHLRNETANVRVVGLTFETRPDQVSERTVNRMLYLGGTRVEMGVQSIYDDVLRIVERGHGVRDVVRATQMLKDSGFKVVYHIMPGLPGSGYLRDLEMVKELFMNDDFRPDMLKIYPTLVVKGTKLYDWWIEGKYKALTDEEAVELISEMYRYIPKWVRVMRVQRDLPAKYIEAGPKMGNLRELVELRALSKGIKINEVRFREVGRSLYRGKRLGKVDLLITKYEASGGVEIFISAEDVVNDILVGLIRVRIPSDKAFRPEVDGKTAIVRELHVYGPQLPVSEKPTDYDTQHIGVGSKLLMKAEEIVLEEYDRTKMLILSGVGAREYYRKLGYFREANSPYMVKLLSQN
ncbi:MAG: tRNA uridine(34) 5-carboxymethylaminomethyl modification radical SAM/GNAT enzyme Elp3 [Sulfolobales archaeon]